MSRPKNLQVKVSKRVRVEACDACGYWKETSHNARLNKGSYPLYTSASHIADALYEIRTFKGSVFLCGHHYHKHEPYIAAMGYTIQELKK